MELKLDVKTLVIGIAIGVIATAVIGAGSADKADFGIAIPAYTGTGDSTALVRTSDDGLYIVNSKTGMAVRVLLAAVKSDPYDRRDVRGKPFNLNSPSQSQKADTGY
ncbi:MAG: hypothetical protein WC454_08710 [Phycisphaerae bacterium]|jgi:hypothetical protein